MRFSKMLAGRPSDSFKITNKTQAMRLLLELGVVGKFLKKPALADRWASAAGYSEHATHWVIAALFEGFPEACDNGYIVFCLPKSEFSLEQVNEVWKAQMGPLFPEGCELALFPVQSAEN